MIRRLSNVYGMMLMMAREEVEVVGEIEQFTNSPDLWALRESCGEDRATIHDNNTMLHNLTPLITLWIAVVSAGKRYVASSLVSSTFPSPPFHQSPFIPYNTLWKAEWWVVRKWKVTVEWWRAWRVLLVLVADVGIRV